MQKSYSESVQKQFEYYKNLGDKTFLQLKEEELFWTYNEESNSVAIIVKHMQGSLSRWTDFLTSDGEKEWRNRDAEFEATIQNKEELLAKWEEGWICLFAALKSVEHIDLDTLVYIRNQGHTITEAINLQLAHSAYHVGQIVFLGKMRSSGSWQSLSIAIGDSNSYNAEKFAKEKGREHFTDEFLEK